MRLVLSSFIQVVDKVLPAYPVGPSRFHLRESAVMEHLVAGLYVDVQNLANQLRVQGRRVVLSAVARLAFHAEPLQIAPDGSTAGFLLKAIELYHNFSRQFNPSFLPLGRKNAIIST